MKDQAQLVVLSIHQAQRSTSKIERLIRKTMDELEVRSTEVSSMVSMYGSISSVNLGSPETLETKVDEESKDLDGDPLDLELPPTPPSQSSARSSIYNVSPISSLFMTQPLQDKADGHVNGEAVDVVTVLKSSKTIHPDPDAQAMVIDSLRSQIQDLFSQVSQLNNKLVQSYDRVSDLEDQLHEASNDIRSSSLKISQLELERTQHMSALNSGLLVEKTHVTAELTRLMEKATEEAARRGQAESARAEIEKDLDDLSAGLFGQANTMVAEARLGKAASERKVDDTERALKSAEEAIAAMQLHMQTLQGEKEEAQHQLEDIRITIGKGKWVQRHTHPDVESSKRLLSSHAQYRDFLYFVSFLREQRQKLPQIPAMNVLLGHSFLSRLQTEDSDPTVRLDLAPSLNWLTRKSVLSAIHQGQLDVEPLPSEILVQELSSAQSVIPGFHSGSHISCALCGAFVLSDPSSHSNAKPPSHPLSRSSSGTSYSGWSSSLLKNPLVNSIAGSVLNTPSHSPVHSSPPPSHVYIFRLAADTTKTVHSPPQSRHPSTMYPLCSSGWCLTRLRATCTLWAFVRTGIVEKVWEETAIPRRPVPSVIATGNTEHDKLPGTVGEKVPPLPPRRSKIGMFWERAASLGKGDIEKVVKEPEKSGVDRSPQPSPSSPSLHPIPAAPKPRTVPPPLPARRGRASNVPTALHASFGEEHSSTKEDGADNETLQSDERKQLSPSGKNHITEPIVPPAEVSAPPLPARRGRTSNVPTAPHASFGEEHSSTKEDGADNETLQSDEGKQLSPSGKNHITEPIVPPAEVFAPPLPARRNRASNAVATVQTPSEDRSSVKENGADDEISGSEDRKQPSPSGQNHMVESPTEISIAVSRGSSPIPVPRPRSPWTIPLPDSVPGTPTLSRPDIPPRTSSPAPPPLPRRALARTRPLSTVHIRASSLTHELSVEQPTEEAADNEATKVGSKSAEDINSAVGDITTKLQERKSMKSDSLAGPEVEYPSPASPTVNDITDVNHLAVDEDNNSSSHEQQEPTEEITINGIAISVVNDHDLVGDVSWEDKTWKEVVKLREDMFWARIGGLR